MKHIADIPALLGLTAIVVTMLALPSSAPGDAFGITTLAPDGTPLSAFIATYDNMHIRHVRIGPDGNIWLTRADNSHGSGQPNPNDMVAVYTLDGTELRTITGGGMRNPQSVGWDSGGNIYLNAEDNYFASDIYKYNPDGNYLTKFHTSGWTLIDDYNDIVTTDTDRIYVSSWHGTGNAHQMTEFTTAGGTVRTFSPTGPTYFHRDAALSPSDTLWVRTPKNGPGDDLLREFDLNGNQINWFSTTAAIGDVLLVGLEVGLDGNLFVLDRDTQILYELTPAGSVVGQTQLGGLAGAWIMNFTFAPNGNILVSNSFRVGLGDLNCDGVVDAFDIDPFVLALTDPMEYWMQYPDCNYMRADLDCDGDVDAFDIDPFVICLTTGMCECPPSP